MEIKNNRIKVYQVAEPKAVILFLHGALEYALRYQELFDFLNQENYLVITIDHPDHGKKHEGNYHLEKISDLEKNAMDLKLFAEENYPNLAHHIIAHSLGTIIARNLILHHNLKFGKVILSGTFNPSKQKLQAGRVIIDIITKITGDQHVSNLANYLMFGSFKQQMYIKYRTTNWINDSPRLYNEYKKDSGCNQKMDNVYIKAIVELTLRAVSPTAIATLKSHEYLIMSGKKDPVHMFGKQLNRFSKIRRIDYQNMRHEILLDENHHIVFNDILNFLEK